MQGIKSFSSTYIDNFKRLSEAVVGFEFEMYTDLSYYKLLELLNRDLKPAKVSGFNQYHSSGKVDAYNFKVEPDGSGGPDMVELITGPMSYHDARTVLVRCLAFIDKYCYTDERCSMHVNVSFDDESNVGLKDMNSLALLLDFDEEVVYREFPDRRNNIYAKSVKKIIPFKDWDDSASATNVVAANMRLPADTKYYGINLAGANRGWLEYRYIGGRNYEKKKESVLNVTDYFVEMTMNAVDAKLTGEHMLKLRGYLDDAITTYSQFKNYDDFLANNQTVELSVDLSSKYEDVVAYYGSIYDDIYDILDGTKYEGDLKVNYDTARSRLEVVESVITESNELSNVDLVECELSGCRISECELVACQVTKAHVVGSKVLDSELKGCKVTGTKAISCELVDCYFEEGELIDTKMDGGIFRSGKIDPDSELTPKTVTNSKGDFWGPGTVFGKKPKGKKR